MTAHDDSTGEPPNVFADLRHEYRTAGLDPSDLAGDPLDQFRMWFDDAVAAGIDEPNAMVLSTVDPEGRPVSRHVLLKSLDALGFRFYTNYNSRKAAHLAGSSACCLLFPWTEVARQVVVLGTAAKSDPAEADAYFASRPRESQLGAWASPQSEVIADRAVLERAFAEAEERFAGRDVERPPHWGGYVVSPTAVEFWQGGLSRLHHRLIYLRDDADSPWHVERRAP